MGNIKLIEEGLNIVNQSKVGHLPLCFRNRLLQSINDIEIINRISILCALKVYPLWKAFVYNDYKIINLLFLCEQFCYKKVSKSDLLENADKSSNYVQSQNDERSFDSIFAGYSAVQAAYEVVSKRLFEDKVDDFDIDSSDWDSAFLASLAYNGGAGDVKDINVERNRSFWTWYLTDCIEYAFDKKKLLLNENEIVKPLYYNALPIPREQEVLYMNSSNINHLFDQLKDIFSKVLNLTKWDTLDFTAYTVADISFDSVLYSKDGTARKFNFEIDILLHINKIVGQIKDLMYDIKKSEGGFYELNMVINKKGEFIKQFNYDHRNKELQEIFQDYNFVDDFKKYPRQPLFIPDWLKMILNNYRVVI